ncbi:hypothetical protein ACN5XJ_26585 (plasmid) [Priestia sp. MF3]|uniref:hypothetical protein n=1 Tax=Priestia sp. MF3 TaxID=3404779 RepID=UPI003BA19A8A
MIKTLIYYQSEKNENIDQIVEIINMRIKSLEPSHVIKGVFIDSFEERKELTELFNIHLINIDLLIVNKPVKDEFDRKLIIELARTEGFKIKLFSEI